MLANELLNQLQKLIDIHGPCPVFHEEYGSYQEVHVPNNLYPATTMVPVGTTYFWIK